MGIHYVYHRDTTTLVGKLNILDWGVQNTRPGKYKHQLQYFPLVLSVEHLHKMFEHFHPDRMSLQGIYRNRRHSVRHTLQNIPLDCVGFFTFKVKRGEIMLAIDAWLRHTWFDYGPSRSRNR